MENLTWDTFLLEEIIEDKIDGPFVKYIGNGSAAPVQLTAKDCAYIADFLAFSQHVQYERTKKMAFVSDFQGQSLCISATCYGVTIISIPGGRTLLIDPQMITHPFVIHVTTCSQC